MNEKQYPSWAIPVVLLLAAGLYLNSLDNELAFDDLGYIANNSILKRIDLVALFTHDLGGKPKGDPNHTGAFRPLTSLTYALNYAAGGLDPVAYHFVNVVFHALCSLLIFFVALRLLNDWKKSLAATLLFAAHPVHTEVVSNVSGRSELLAGVFFLLGLWIYLRYRDTPTPARLAGILAAYLAAILSKESAITLPGAVLLIDILLPAKLESNDGHNRFLTKQQLHAYAGFLLAAAGYLLLRSFLVGSIAKVPYTEVENPMAFAPAVPRWLTRFYLLTIYAKLLVWPVRLSADYSFNQIPLLESFGDPRNIVTLLAAAVFIGLLVWSFRSSRPVCFGLAFIAVTFSITSNIFISIGTVIGERLLYVPSFGFCLALAVLLKAIPTTWKHPAAQKVSNLILAVLLAGYCARTLARNPDWKSTLTIMKSAEEVSPNSVKVNSNLGQLYKLRGDPRMAEEYYRRSLEIRPCHSHALAGLSFILAEEGRLKELLAIYKQASQYDHGDARIPYYCGMGLVKRNRFSGALAMFTEVLQINADFHAARLHLGYCLDKVGKTDEALAVYREAVERTPSSTTPLYNLCLLYLRLKRLDEAEDSLRSAPPSAQRHSQLLKVRYNLALLLRVKERKRAADHFEFILKVNPRYPKAQQMWQDIARWRK